MEALEQIQAEIDTLIAAAGTGKSTVDRQFIIRHLIAGRFGLIEAELGIDRLRAENLQRRLIEAGATAEE